MVNLRMAYQRSRGRALLFPGWVMIRAGGAAPWYWTGCGLRAPVADSASVAGPFAVLVDGAGVGGIVGVTRDLARLVGTLPAVSPKREYCQKRQSEEHHR